jgi:mono/diheme cytochrome c family protein
MLRAHAGMGLLLLSAGAAVGLAACDANFAVDTDVQPPTAISGIAGTGSAFPASPGFACPIQMSAGSAAPSPGPSPDPAERVVMQEKAPPPISGGTLLLTADRSKLIAADPDRDAVFVVDVESRSLLRRVQLEAADEPGRAVEDDAGRVHVALRGGRGIATFALEGDAAPRRSRVCDLPRGLAYEANAGRLFVACAEGVLVRVDPTTGKPESRIQLGRDLRDVIARDGLIHVSRFRSAELITLDAISGEVKSVRTPPSSDRLESRVTESFPSGTEGCGNPVTMTSPELVSATPDLAWRTLDLGARGVAMMHQRATTGEVRITSGGYGAPSQCGSGIVSGSITVLEEATHRTMDITESGLFVDLAYDAANDVFAFVNAGGASANSISNVLSVRGPGGSHPSGTFVPCGSPFALIPTPGHATSVVFVTSDIVAVQDREPAAITFLSLSRTTPSVTVPLDDTSREDRGHILFHMVTSGGVACASCHGEAGDDGHVWKFEGIGARRTQSVRGGILGTEPFHWNGDMHDFPALVQEVFVERMGAFPISERSTAALARWIDAQPLFRVTPEDTAAVERGRALFMSEEVGCAKCHTGAKFTDNKFADVGTGAMLQVPSLQGVAFREPLMHDGCAPTLRDRFAACGGGDSHGKTNHLAATQLDDLTAYLETL